MPSFNLKKNLLPILLILVTLAIAFYVLTKPSDKEKDKDKSTFVTNIKSKFTETGANLNIEYTNPDSFGTGGATWSGVYVVIKQCDGDICPEVFAETDAVVGNVVYSNLISDPTLGKEKERVSVMIPTSGIALKEGYKYRVGISVKNSRGQFGEFAYALEAFTWGTITKPGQVENVTGTIV